MIFFGLGVWQTYVVVLYAISKAIRRKPYRDRVPSFSSPICNHLGPHLLRPYLLRQYLLRLLLLKDYSDDFQEVFYDVLLSGQLTLVFSLPGSRLSLKMDLPELPPRMFTVGEEPAAIRSISYHSDDTKLFKALCDCLTADEYEDLKASKLGVFIKFKELGFGWTSRLFEHLTGLNCDYIKDLENPRCEVTKEVAAFWEKMGVDLDTGPNAMIGLGMIASDWDTLPSTHDTLNGKSVDGFSEGKDLTQTDRTSPLLLAYKGGQGRRRCFKSAINRQINVNNFVQKDLDEMFPEWDGDVEDPAADNIIKIERAFKDISDAISDGFGTCLKEIKLLGDRMGAVEKMITKKGSSSDELQLTTTSNPPKPVHEPGVSTKTSPKIAEKRVTWQSVRKNDLPSDEPSVLILDKQVSTASDLLLEEARR
ncbi:unnamed protein product [Brassica oleracea]